MCPRVTPEPSEALAPLAGLLAPRLLSTPLDTPTPTPTLAVAPAPSPSPKQASQLIKDVEKTFGLVDDEDDGAAAEE